MTQEVPSMQSRPSIKIIHNAQPLHNVHDDGYPQPPASQRTLRNVAVHNSKALLLKAIYLVMSTIGTILTVSRIGKRYPLLHPQSFHPRRILVIRLDLIGDLVMSLTLIRVLKRTYPNAEIDLLAVPASAAVVAADPDLANIITYDPNIWRRPKALFKWNNWRAAFALRQHLKACHYDLAISVFGEWAAIMAVISGATRRLSFAQEGYPGFMTDSVSGRHWKPQDHLHEVDYCLALARAAGATTTEEDRVPTLTVVPQALQEIEQLLQQSGIAADKPLIACHVSSNNGQSKRWPIPYWAALLDKLMLEGVATVVLTGAPNDLSLIERIIQRMKQQQQPLNLAGKTNLTQLAALLARADLMLTGDSGPMHIATAVGTPVIAIHGPTDPALSGPVSPKALVLRNDIWCSPCYDAKGPADCRFYTTQCMKNITPHVVFDIVHQQLQAQSRLSAAPEQEA